MTSNSSQCISMPLDVFQKKLRTAFRAGEISYKSLSRYLIPNEVEIELEYIMKAEKADVESFEEKSL